MGAVASRHDSDGKRTSAALQTSALFVAAVFVLVRLRTLPRWVIQKLRLGSPGIVQAAKNLILQLIDSIQKNPLMESMLATGALSYFVYLIRSFIQKIVADIQGMFYCSISIQNTDENYTSVVDYVTKHCQQDKSYLVATTKKQKLNRKQWQQQWNGILGKRAPELELRPSRNVMTSFRFKGKRILLWRGKGQTITTGWDRRPLTMETITLTCFGTDNRILRQLLKEAMVDKIVQDSGDINVYVLSNGWMGGWEKALTKSPRDKDTVVLDSNIAEELLHDAKTFLTSQRWYAERGIPYRRGYLLYGPPGCGKTSFTQVIAGELKQDMCMLSLSDKTLNDNKLAANLREAPENSIILLEDVDAVFLERSVQKDSQSTVTFSGLLNAIDGVASQEGRMLFMTTNHIEKLDPALIRPGRCDVRVELKKASSMQMKQLFLRFFPGDSANANLFALKLPKFELSMAQLQGHLLENRQNARLAIERIPKLLQSTKPQPTARVTIYAHLRRVGLEQYAAFFEHHGYSYRDQLQGLDANAVAQWIVELRYERQTKKVMELLLNGDSQFYKSNYELAELSTIREAFIAAYPVEHMVRHGEAPPKLRRLSSHERHGLVQNNGLNDLERDGLGFDSKVITSSAYGDDGILALDEKKSAEYDLVPDRKKYYHGVVAREIEDLSKELCEKLSKNGKGTVSMWQLHHLFSIFYDPRECVKNAHILTRPRPQESKMVQPMSSFDWLKRANMAKAVGAFESKKKMTAHDLLKIQSHDLGKYPCPGIDRNVLAMLIENKPADANITAGMQVLGRSRVVNKFLLHFPGDFKSALEFAMKVTDDMGRGLASEIQLNAHFKKYKGDVKQCLEKAKKELVDIEKVEIPPPPPVEIPNVWVKLWLTKLGMKGLAQNFINNNLKHYEDIVCEPIISDKEMKDCLGVSKLGWRRKLQREIKILLAGGCDGLKKVYRAKPNLTALFNGAKSLDKLADLMDDESAQKEQ